MREKRQSCCYPKARTSDPQRNVMGQSTEMSPLASMLSRTFLTPLKFIREFFNILVYCKVCHTTMHYNIFIN